MKVELYKNVDQVSINDLSTIYTFDQEFITDYFEDPFTFNIGVVHDRNRIVGAGIIRVINEFKMIIDQDLPKNIKSRILKMLIEKAIELKQCKEVMISLTLPKTVKEMNKYSKMLQEHYDFWRDPGILLRRDCS